MPVVIPTRRVSGLILSVLAAVVLFLAGCAKTRVAAPPQAKKEATPGCEQWNTEEFFETATVDDVTACLAAGSDPMAREYHNTERTALHTAAMASRSPEVIQILLGAGADVNALDASGETPLEAALRFHAPREPAVIEALLAGGADPNVRGSNGRTPLHYAAYGAKDADLIKALIEAGAELDARDSGTPHSMGGITPLHLAISSDAVPAAIEALLAAGADVNAQDDMGARPLHRVKREEALAILLAAGAAVNARSAGGVTPLHSALDTSPATIELLLAAGANVNARDDYERTPLHFVARENISASGIKLLIAAGADPMARSTNGATPLHYAAKGNGNPAVFRPLLAAGADLNTRDGHGQTPLYYAAKHNGNPVAFQTLLAAGADVNVRADDGETLLHVAAANEHPKVIETLLAAGADVNARDPYDEMPLHVAARYSGWVECCLPSPLGLHPGPIYESTAVVEVLLAAGADVNARGVAGSTPLHWAARINKNPEILEVLLAGGADVNAKNIHGQTPLDLANRRLPLEMREILRAHPLPPRPPGTDVEDVAVFQDCPTCPELLTVPAGRFRMGCVFDENACWSKANLPTHQVDVASVALSKFEVTRGQFAAFVAATGYDTSGGCRYEPGSWRALSWQSDDHPVVCVSWDDAQAYVKWLREKTGHRYRLPTESEWEYAIRAGTKTRFYWGYRAPDMCKYANSEYCEDGWERTAPVGSFRANGFGLHDMAGNVSEWVEDCWHENYDGAPRDGSAWTGSGDCGRRVARGGNWGASLARHFRSADRDEHEVGFRFFRLGFRVARPLSVP